VKGRRRPSPRLASALSTAARAALAVVAFLVLCGHVGSPDVYFDGDAGPYPVRVIVRPPVVVPGLAEITVRLRQEGAPVPGPGPVRVTVQPVVWNAGAGGSPPPDLAQPVPGAPRLWSAQLWLMTASSYSIRVAVEGDAGRGAAIVPVAAVRLQRLGMPRSLGVVLAALGAFLLLGGLTVVGAAVRESTLEPGAPPDAARRARARAAIAGAALLLALAVWGGRAWWNDVDAEYRDKIYRPFRTAASVRIAGGARLLTVSVDDERWRRDSRLPLMPDHGKLMHLFLVRQPAQDAFAHLHPVPRRPGDDQSFAVTLPALPAGSYALYADVTQENGLPSTLTATVEMPEVPEVPPAPAAGSISTASSAAAVPFVDPDDSVLAATPAVGGPGSTSDLGDGYTMTWMPPAPAVAGRDGDLRFAVRVPGGRPAAIEPYMGMLSHAAIRRDDGQVFVHLHPQGTVSMAAQQVFAWREARAAAGLPVAVAIAPRAAVPGYRTPIAMRPAAAPAVEDMAAMPMPAAAADGRLRFPYGFPKTGRYRLWVQVRTGGKVRTGVFDTRIAAG
jgi:hypothetical protein